MKSIFKITALGTAMALAACSSLESDKIDYRATAKAPALTVPPDLTQLSKESRYTMVDGGVSAVSGKANASSQTQAAITLPNEISDIRIERAGNQRWLVVKRPVDKVWGPVRDFWIDNGFLLSMDQSNLGIMETEWTENRAKIPQDFVHATLGKVLNALYSTPERDKYRTRLETNANGETEIFVSHRGVAEVYTAERSNQTMWQVRPTDPELEAEYLRRLMLQLGSSPEQAKTLLATTPSAKSVASISDTSNQAVLVVAEGFDRAWRRVGLALDRTGFTVEDRDRSRGLYFVRYVAAESQQAEPGFFAKLFTSTPEKTTQAGKYQIAIKSEGDSSTVSVLDSKGVTDTSATAQRIVKVLADDIK